MKIIDERNGKLKPFVDLPIGTAFEFQNDIYIKIREYNYVNCDAVCIGKTVGSDDIASDELVLPLKAELHIVGMEE